MLHISILSALWTKRVHHDSPKSPQQSGQMAFWISQSGCFFPAKNRPLLFLIQLSAKLYNLTASLQLNLFPERCVSSSCVISEDHYQRLHLCWAIVRHLHWLLINLRHPTDFTAQGAPSTNVRAIYTKYQCFFPYSQSSRVRCWLNLSHCWGKCSRFPWT